MEKLNLDLIEHRFNAGQRFARLPYYGNTLHVIASEEEVTFKTRDGKRFPCVPGFAYNLPPEMAFEVLELTRTNAARPLLVRFFVGFNPNAAALPVFQDTRAVADITVGSVGVQLAPPLIWSIVPPLMAAAGDGVALLRAADPYVVKRRVSRHTYAGTASIASNPAALVVGDFSGLSLCGKSDGMASASHHIMEIDGGGPLYGTTAGTPGESFDWVIEEWRLAPGIRLPDRIVADYIVAASDAGTPIVTPPADPGAKDPFDPSGWDDDVGTGGSGVTHPASGYAVGIPETALGEAPDYHAETGQYIVYADPADTWRIEVIASTYPLVSLNVSVDGTPLSDYSGNIEVQGNSLAVSVTYQGRSSTEICAPENPYAVVRFTKLPAA